jgi:hypothetical protein
MDIGVFIAEDNPTHALTPSKQSPVKNVEPTVAGEAAFVRYSPAQADAT